MSFRGNRIRWPHRCRAGSPRLHPHPLHRPKSSDSPRPGAARCVHLHDPRPPDPPAGRRRIRAGQNEMDDQDLRRR
ncbi:hypothetical protein VTG60DRAFT_7292 [Thermothelomyces hinnuleus]